MKLRNILLGSIGLVVVVYGGIYLYMYSKVKSGVDDFALQASMLGNFSYGGVSVSPFGSRFSIDDISFTPHGYNDALRIDSIRLQVDNLLDLMTLSRQPNPNMELPQHGEVAMAGIHIPMHSDWLRQLDDSIRQEFSSINYKPQICGGHVMIGSEHFEAMGFEEIIADISFRFFHDTRLGRFENDMDFTLRELGQLNYKLVTSAPTSSRLMSLATMGQPSLQLNRLTYTDLGYTRKANDFCARADNTSVAEFIEAQVNQPDADYLMTWGIVPGPGIRAALKRFLTEPQTVEFLIDPTANFDTSTLYLYKARDIPTVLNLQVKVNGQAIEDLSFKTAEEAAASDNTLADIQYSFAGQLGMLSNMLAPEPAPVVNQPTASAKKEKPRFRAISLQELEQHIGAEVKVLTHAGLSREGTLDRVEGSTIFVVKTLRGGRFTMPVPFGQVKKVEALF